MKKMKTLLLTLALGFTLAGAATTVACGDKGGATSSDWFAGTEQGSSVNLRFSASQVKVAQYETQLLPYKVSGTLEAVSFSSSDDSIVSVDSNGIITAKGALGKAIITAEVEGISATCEVEVTESFYVPVIVTGQSQYSIENGGSLNVQLSTEWNKVALDEEIEYSVSLAEDSQNAQASVEIVGNTLKVVSNGVETFDVVVSATVRDIYTSKVITINVGEPQIKITSTSTAFKPAEGKYTLNISATAEAGNLANSFDLDFSVMKGGALLSDASISWSVSEGEGNVEIKDGVIVGKKRGSATLVGSVDYNGESASVEIECEVIPVDLHLEQTAVIEIEDLKTLKITEDLIGTMQNVELNGKVVSARVIDRTQLISFLEDAEAKANGEKNPYFPSAAKDLGEQQMIINTDQARYTMDVTLYSMVINDAAELDKMVKLADTGETEWNTRAGYEGWHSSQRYDGYFVLGNDIEYNKEFTSMTDTGAVWWCQGTSDDLSRGFQGVFDGQGYNINGLSASKNPTGSNQAGGMFGYLSKEGIVKNVSFTNATVATNNGFICAYGDGTIENVSISYKQVGTNIETTDINGSNPAYTGSFFTKKAGNNAKVSNCLVDASAAEIIINRGLYSGRETMSVKLNGLAKSVENVIVICPNQEVLNASGATVSLLTYNDAIKNSSLMSKFDKEIWTTVEGIPMFVKQAESLNRDAGVEFLNVKDSLVTGFEMLVLTNNPYSKIEVEDVAGVTFENSILTATEEAYKQTVTLTATSLLNPSITATHEVYVDSFGEAIATPTTEKPVVYNANPVLNVGDNSWKSDKNYVYLNENVIGESKGPTDLIIDWQQLGWGDSSVTIVTEDDQGVRKNFAITITVDYVRGDKTNAEKVLDCAMVDVAEKWNNNLIYRQETSDLGAPTGFASVSQFSGVNAWTSALEKTNWSPMDVSEYSDLWFAMKIVNGRWVMLGTQRDSIGGYWVYFHYTQTNDGVWALDITYGEEQKHFLTVYDITNGPKLQDLIYRGGWSTGFLLYNNNSGEEGGILPHTTSVYCTELVGIKKA